MGIKNRIPKSTRDRQNIKEIENKFISSTEKDNLGALSLEELANAFESIEQQAQLVQGRILLEARGRFESDTLFGAWIKESGSTLCATSHQQRTRLINLARFFENRPIDKISITAAYEISAPVNADVANEIYNLVLYKNISVAEVKTLIAKAKLDAGMVFEQKSKDIQPSLVEIIPPEITDAILKKRLFLGIEGVPPLDAIRVMNEIIAEIQTNI